MMDKTGNTLNAHQQWNEQVSCILTQRNGDQETTTLYNNVDDVTNKIGKKRTKNIETMTPFEFKDRQN